jgi:hypothetical protein
MQTNMDDTTSTVREATRPFSLVRPAIVGPATNVAVCRGECVGFIVMGYDNALCSLAGRPHTPRPREKRDHPPISEAELVKKRDIFDPLEDDDVIDWKYNPFDERESPEQLMSKITFKGSPQLQTRLRYQGASGAGCSRTNEDCSRPPCRHSEEK